MRRFMMPVLAAAALTLSLAVQAQTPSVTATCKDGTPYSGTTRSGACRGHGGVQTWGNATNSNAPPAAPPANSPATNGPAKPPPAQTAAGMSGSPGQVWVNTKSRVYHCPGDRWYGKTEAGEYMTEAQAKTGGYRPDHNKTCAS
jgi:hypothetical protein